MRIKSIMATLMLAVAGTTAAFATSPLPLEVSNRAMPMPGAPVLAASDAMKWVYNFQETYEWRSDNSEWEKVSETEYVYDSEGNLTEITYTYITSGYVHKTVYEDFENGYGHLQTVYNAEPGGDFIPQYKLYIKFDPKTLETLEGAESMYDAQTGTWREKEVFFRIDTEADDKGRLMSYNTWNMHAPYGLHMQKSVEYHYPDADSREPDALIVRNEEITQIDGEYTPVVTRVDITDLEWERYDVPVTDPFNTLELGNPAQLRPRKATVIDGDVTTNAVYSYEGDEATYDATTSLNERTVMKRRQVGPYSDSFRYYVKNYVDGELNHARIIVGEKERMEKPTFTATFMGSGESNKVVRYSSVIRYLYTDDAETGQTLECIVQTISNPDMDFSDISLEQLYNGEVELPESVWENMSRAVYDGWIQVPDAAVETVEATPDADAPVEYFTLDGRRVAQPAPGIVIERRGTTVTKRVIR